MGFKVIDIIFAALVVIFTVRCAVRGFISELLSMAALVLGLLAALIFCGKGGELVRVKFMPEMKIIPEILAFIGLFLIVFIAIKILEAMLKSIIEGIKLGGADRFLGLIFGFVEGIIVVSLVLFLFSVQPLFDPNPVLKGSFFAELLLPLITGSGKAAVESAVESAALRITAGGIAGV